MILSDGISEWNLRLERCKEPINVSIENFDMLGRICAGDTALILSTPPTDPWIFADAVKENFESRVYILGREREVLRSDKDIVVDWYSHRSERVIAVEARKENYIRASYDPASLLMAVKEALKRTKGKTLVYFDALSTFITSLGFKKAYPFLKNIVEHITSTGKTTLLLPITKEFHTRAEICCIEEMAGTIISLHEEGGTIKISIPTTMTGSTTAREFVLELLPKPKISVPRKEKKKEVEELPPHLREMVEMLRKRDEMLLLKEDELRYKEALLRIKEEEFKRRIKMFQKELMRHIKEKNKLSEMKREIEEERKKLRKELEELRKMWELVKGNQP
ncbi:MAG: hypothetical protein DRN20_06480 [Thermoplasmata archaeon]|nr:MAG: hypothetical protein DRN20_06480 [Thermoplasmata archaeon]